MVQKEDSYEVVVCHANVIRYFVCKALQVPTEVWGVVRHACAVRAAANLYATCLPPCGAG
jgi:hypothetical protein